MRLKILIVIAVPLMASLMTAPVRADETTDALVDSLIREVDRLYRSETSYTELEMEIITPHWQRTLKMNFWSKGMEDSFIRILSPKKERGVA